MLCFRCNYQGIVNRVRVRATGCTIYVCDECEATWLTKEDLGTYNFVGFSRYMRAQGFTRTWKECDAEENWEEEA